MDDSIQVLLAVAISARILGNGKRGSLRESHRSFGTRRSLRKARFV